LVGIIGTLTEEEAQLGAQLEAEIGDGKKQSVGQAVLWSLRTVATVFGRKME
jgi:hypothetical protein